MLSDVPVELAVLELGIQLFLRRFLRDLPIQRTVCVSSLDFFLLRLWQEKVKEVDVFEELDQVVGGALNIEFGNFVLFLVGIRLAILLDLQKVCVLMHTCPPAIPIFHYFIKEVRVQLREDADPDFTM